MIALDRALAYSGTHDAEDIAIGVAEGRFQAWSSDKSTIITEVLVTPLQKIVNFFLAEGDLRDIEIMTPGIMAWAKRQGCTHANFVGRFGWQRSFVKKFGFVEYAVMMKAEL